MRNWSQMIRIDDKYAVSAGAWVHKTNSKQELGLVLSITGETLGLKAGEQYEVQTYLGLSNAFSSGEALMMTYMGDKATEDYIVSMFETPEVNNG